MSGFSYQLRLQQWIRESVPRVTDRVPLSDIGKNLMKTDLHVTKNIVATLIFAIALPPGIASAQTQSKPQNLSQPARAVGQLPNLGTVAIAVPDVTFDAPASQLLANQKVFNVVLKNIGASASAPFEVQCSFRELILPPTSYSRWYSKTQKFLVPAIAIGASYTTKDAGPPADGSAFLWRTEIKCTADAASTSGEVNKRNNAFDYSPPNTPSTPSAPSADIAFDVAATTEDAKNNTSRITLKNIGNLVSQPFKVSCETVVDTLLVDGTKQRNTSTSSLDVPQLAAGATHATLGLQGAWIVERLTCTADTGNTSGETNKANNTFTYQRASDFTRSNLAAASNLSGVGTAVSLAAPDLAFDVPSMTADASRLGANTGVPTSVGYRVAVKNVGARASKPTEVTCTDTADFLDTAPGPNQGKPLPRRTWSWARPVPAVAPGATYKDQVEVLGNEDLVKRNCVIDGQSVSGDSNKSNNTFEFQKTSNFTAPLAQKPVLVPVPAAGRTQP
jgi:hypothetical protein